MAEQTKKKEAYSSLRKHAEELIAKSPRSVSEALPEDLWNLVHELNASQIELEIQNEELRHAQEVIEKSRHKYSDLYDFAPVGYLTTDKNGLITQANLTLAALLLRDRSTLPGKPVHLFVAPADQDTYYLHRKKTLQSSVQQTCEVWFKRADNSRFWGHIESVIKVDDDNNIQIRSVVTDITSRKRAEAILDERENRFRELFQHMSSGAAVYEVADGGKDFVFKDINWAGERIEKVKREDVLGRKVTETFPAIEDFGLLEVFRRVWGTGKPEFFPVSFYEDERISGWRENYVCKLPSGEVVVVYDDVTKRKQAEDKLKQEAIMRGRLIDNLPCIAMILKKGTREIIASNEAARMAGAVPGKTCYQTIAQRDDSCPFCLAPELWATDKPKRLEVGYRGAYYEGVWAPLTEELYVHYIFDISDRMLAKKRLIKKQEQLRSLATQLSLSEERERKRIAEGLHDNIIQNLIFLKLRLSSLAKGGKGVELENGYEDFQEKLSEIIDQARSLTFDLSCPILYQLGIEAAIRNWFEIEFVGNQDLETEITCEGNLKFLSDDKKGFLFRAVKELAVNVVKHAHANRIKVSIMADQDNIEIKVEDDGEGFPPSADSNPLEGREYFGLFSIKERLGQMGGCLEVDSKPGKGTCVLLKVPLNEDASVYDG